MITVQRAGISIAIVDRGRYGYRRYGVPTSGAMDMHSAAAANALVGNHQDQALLECYMPGHRLQFSSDKTIALTGAQAEIFVNHISIESNKAYSVSAGAILSIGKFSKGAYLYLAIQGGIQVHKTLGSCSPLASYHTNRIRTGDTIPTSNHSIRLASNARISPINIDPHQVITATKGPEWHFLSPEATTQLLSTDYLISSQSDQMGFRLQGDPVKDKIQGILSSGVMPGTVQLLPSGLPLVLMRACQTTGGYIRILQITPDSLNQLAQRRPGQKVKFDIINVDEFKNGK